MAAAFLALMLWLRLYYVRNSERKTSQLEKVTLKMPRKTNNSHIGYITILVKRDTFFQDQNMTPPSH